MIFIKRYDIDDKELKKLALEECKLIADYFTSDELNKLKLHLVCPDTEKSCVYGLMTGNCNSERACNFIKTLDKVFSIINEKHLPEYRTRYYLTPLEEFIYDDSLSEEYNNLNLDEQDRIPNTILIINEIKRLQNENN